MRKNASYILVLAAVVLLAMLVSIFKWQLLLIHGDSMAPTYRSFSLVLLDKQPGAYSRGDVVLYRCESLGRGIVKRIAAVPGDRLRAEDGTLLINDEPTAPLPGGGSAPGIPHRREFTVPDGSFFLLGDNLEHSIDSLLCRNRACGGARNGRESSDLSGRRAIPIKLPGVQNDIINSTTYRVVRFLPCR